VSPSVRPTQLPLQGPPPTQNAPGNSSLAPRALNYLNVRTGFSTAAAVAVLGGGICFLPDVMWRGILGSVVAALAIISLCVELPWLNRKEVQSCSYTVTPDFVYISRGWLWRRSTTIPTAQILNVEIVQGPLLRMFDVVSVRFTCISEVEALRPLEWSAAELARTTVLLTRAEPLE